MSFTLHRSHHARLETRLGAQRILLPILLPILCLALTLSGVSRASAQALPSDAPLPLTLLVDGQEAYPRVIDLMRTARQSIALKAYLWRDDPIGQELAAALLEAADRGIRVSLEKDRVAVIFETAELSKRSFFHRTLTPAERWRSRLLDLAYSTPGEGKRQTRLPPGALQQRLASHPLVQLNAETSSDDHSKYYVFDDEILLLGGMNIGEEYVHRWHDYLVEVRSPDLVKRFQARLAGTLPVDPQREIEFVFNRSGTPFRSEIKPMMLSLLEGARREITFEMAYFGDMDIHQALLRAAARGVEVKLVLPEKANVQDNLNRHLMQDLMDLSQGRIQVYLYPEMLHAKLLHVDGNATLVGSANANPGLSVLGDADILIRESGPFHQRLHRRIQEDLARSRHIQRSVELTHRSWLATLEALHHRTYGERGRP